jgi:hypothetical protein
MCYLQTYLKSLVPNPDEDTKEQEGGDQPRHGRTGVKSDLEMIQDLPP